jgi:SAM-dependent methyltransferase
MATIRVSEDMRDSNDTGKEPAKIEDRSGRNRPSDVGAQPTEWTEDKVRKLLANQEFTYQKVNLPYGLSTGGTDRSPTARLIFPENLAGKSVFDVGCMYGYFTFEAEERGAAHFAGGDVDPANVAKCRLLASARGSKAEFRQLDIERDPLPGVFDYVLCLNVLHHLRNPLAALEKLIAATRECLVLEVASLTYHDSRKLGLPAMLGSGLMARLPILYLGGAGKAKGASQSFFFTESAIHTLLKKHRQDFASVEVRHGGQKGRFIVIARKRRIGHLYIVAGVNVVGKSTFLNSLARGSNADIAQRIDLDVAKPWLLKGYGYLVDEAQVDIPYLLLQYNISKYLIDGDLHLHERGLLDVIRCAEKVTIATFWHSGPELSRRYQAERVKSPLGLKMRRASKKANRLLKLYGNPAQFNALYADWFDFTKRYAEASYVVLQEPAYRAISIERWESEIKSQSSNQE